MVVVIVVVVDSFFCLFFSTNDWSTFDIEVCFLRHRLHSLTKVTADICGALPRIWTSKEAGNSADPVFHQPLCEVIKRFRETDSSELLDFDPYHFLPILEEEEEEEEEEDDDN
jgi:hypothetical protein